MDTPESIQPQLDLQAKYNKLIKIISEENICMLTLEIFFLPVTMSDGDAIEEEAFNNYAKDCEQKQLALRNPEKRTPVDKKTYPNNHLRKTIAKLLDYQPELWAEVYLPKALIANFETHLNNNNISEICAAINQHPRLLLEKINNKHNAITFLELIAAQVESSQLTIIIKSFNKFKTLVSNHFKSEGEALFRILVSRRDINNIKLLAALFGWQSGFYLKQVYWAIASKKTNELKLCLELSDVTNNVDEQLQIFKAAVKIMNFSVEVIKILFNHFNFTAEQIKDFKNIILHEAIKEKADALVQFILDEDADPLSLNDQQETAFHAAVRLSSLQILKFLLIKIKWDKEKRDKLLISLLKTALENNREDMVEYLLSEGVDPLTYDEKHIAIIHTALHKGNDDIIKLLTSKIEPYNLLSFVSSLRSVASDIVLLEQKMRWGRELYQEQAWLAVEKKDLNTLGICCLNGIDLNLQNKKKKYKGKTLLHIALQTQFDSGTSLLLEAGASVDIKDRKGNAALHTAAMTANEVLLRRIIDKSPKQLQECNNKSQYPCQLAAEHNKHNEKVLLEYFKLPIRSQHQTSSSQITTKDYLKQTETADNFIQRQNKALLSLPSVIEKTSAAPYLTSSSEIIVRSAVPLVTREGKISVICNNKMSKDYGDISLLQKRSILVEKLLALIIKSKNSHNCIFAIQILSKMKVSNEKFREALLSFLNAYNLQLAKEAAKALMQIAGGRLVSEADMNETQAALLNILIKGYVKKEYRPEIIVFIAGQVATPSEQVITLLKATIVHENPQVRFEAAKALIKLMPIYEAMNNTPFEKSYILNMLIIEDDNIKELFINSFEVQIKNAVIIVKKLLAVLFNANFHNVQFKIFNKLSQFMALSEDVSQLIVSHLKDHKEIVISNIHRQILQRGDKCEQHLLTLLNQFENSSDTINFIFKQCENRDINEYCNALSILEKYKHHSAIIIKQLLNLLYHNNMNLLFTIIKILMCFNDELSDDEWRSIESKKKLLAAGYIDIIRGNNSLNEKLDSVNRFGELQVKSKELNNKFFKILDSLMSDYRMGDTVLDFISAVNKLPTSQNKIVFLQRLSMQTHHIEIIGTAIDGLKQSGITIEKISDLSKNTLQTNVSDSYYVNAIQIYRSLKIADPLCIQACHDLLSKADEVNQYYAAIALAEFNHCTPQVVSLLMKIISAPNELLFHHAIKALTSDKVLNVDIIEYIIDQVVTTNLLNTLECNDVANAVAKVFAQINQLEVDFKDFFEEMTQSLLEMHSEQQVPAAVSVPSPVVSSGGRR